MSGKVIAQIIIQLGAVGVRMFGAAYSQALNNAKRGGGGAVGNAAAQALRGKMQPAEALQVLNIEQTDLNVKLLDETFKRMHNLNDPAKGGSFYLQSKIFRAKEALMKELNEPFDVEAEQATVQKNPGTAKKSEGAPGQETEK